MSKKQFVKIEPTLQEILDNPKKFNDPELRKFLPRVNTPSEDGIGCLDQLTQNILNEGGIRDTLTFSMRPDGSMVLIDGYTRLSIVYQNKDKLDLSQKVVCNVIKFKSKAEEMSWMRANNAGRRSLSKEQDILSNEDLLGVLKARLVDIAFAEQVINLMNNSGLISKPEPQLTQVAAMSKRQTPVRMVDITSPVSPEAEEIARMMADDVPFPAEEEEEDDWVPFPAEEEDE